MDTIQPRERPGREGLSLRASARRMPARFLILLVRGYQATLRPWFGGRSSSRILPGG